MLARRPAPVFAFALLLLLAACQEETAQQSSALSDTAAALADTGMTLPDTSGGTGTAGGIDTSGTGPASIPQGRYTTTASGLKYYDLREGSGPSPQPTDRVRVHYTGWLQSNGQKFDSSYDRGQPATFPLNGVIEGWTEGLQSMQVGGKRQLVVPPDLAYGARQRGPIPPNATLVFEVELLGIPSQQGGGAGS